MIPVEVLMPNYLTKQWLLKRGWTERLVNQLLGSLIAALRSTQGD
jgi:hypothetical protein